MLTLLKKIFIWWNQETLGTKLKTIFYGKLIGIDSLGNKYYESKAGKDGLFIVVRLMLQKYQMNGIRGFILLIIKLKIIMI